MKANKLKSEILSLFNMFIVLFIILLFASILLQILANLNIKLCKDILNWFTTWIFNGNTMNNPFSIFIELITMIIGVFFGIRIDQWVDKMEEKEKENSIWRRINTFLKKIKSGIEQNENIYGLAEYKIHWDSLLRDGNYSTQLIQEDDECIEISFVFSFLTHYSNSWDKFENINAWKLTTTMQIKEKIEKWEENITKYIEYTEKKASSQVPQAGGNPSGLANRLKHLFLRLSHSDTTNKPKHFSNENEPI